MRIYVESNINPILKGSHMLKKLNGKPVTHLYFVRQPDGTVTISQHSEKESNRITEQMKRVLKKNKKK